MFLAKFGNADFRGNSQDGQYHSGEEDQCSFQFKVWCNGSQMIGSPLAQAVKFFGWC